MGIYRVAQICLNGHVITDSLDVYPEQRENFCSGCGQKTITNCPKCNTLIRGDYHVDGVCCISSFTAPSFCHHCGSPYPWTDAKIKAAQELISEDERLTPTDKETLSLALPDIISDTPNTQLAATRYKKLISKAVAVTGEGLKQILVDVVSETAKKMLWP